MIARGEMEACASVKDIIKCLLYLFDLKVTLLKTFNVSS